MFVFPDASGGQGSEEFLGAAGLWEGVKLLPRSLDHVKRFEF